MEEVRRIHKKAQFQKALAKRLQDLRVPSAKLRGELQNAYKIKLRDVGYRLVTSCNKLQQVAFDTLLKLPFNPSMQSLLTVFFL